MEEERKGESHLIIIDSEICFLGPQIPHDNGPTLKANQQLKTERERERERERESVCVREIERERVCA